MKALKILLVLVVIVVVLLVAGVFALNSYLQTSAFKELVLSSARQALGSDVKITDMNISLFRGVTLQGVAIRNPSGFPGDLLTADAFVLRYRLLPLLRRRVEVQQLSLEKPLLTLARNEKGEWNYEKIGVQQPPPPAGTPAGPAAPPKSAPTGTSAAGFDIALSKLAMDDAEVVMMSEQGKALTRIQHLTLDSSVNLAGKMLSGQGKASIETLAVADSLFVRRLTTTVSISADEVKLAPLTGTCADGNVTGELALKLTGGSKYSLKLQLKDGDIAKLIEEAGVTKRVMTGKLQATADLEGTGGLPTMTGKGRAEIVEGKLLEMPALNLLATLLQVQELRDLKFDECVMEFTIADNVMQTPVIRLTSPVVQITGKGAVSLADYSLNHDLTLAFAPNSLDNAPKEIRALFTQRSDGFLTLDFRVWGPYDSPKTDLKERIVRGATEQLLEKGLQKLLK